VTVTAEPTGIAIREVRSIVYRAPIAIPVQTSFGTMRERPMVLVRIEDDEGAVGWGEVWCNFPACGAEHRARLVATVVAPLLLRRALVEPGAIFAGLTRQTEILALQCGEPGPIAQVVAGVDIALWDLFARRRGRPLWQLLGGENPTVAVYASGLSPHEPVSLAVRARERGFRAFKLKVGFGAKRDESNLLALRAALGADAELMVDANQAWDIDQALEAVRPLERHGLRWLEEPLRADRPPAEWERLARATAIPLAIGENLASRAAFDAAIASSAFGVLQPDVAKWGGISAGVEVARAIRAGGRRFCPHYLGGGVGLTASAHLLAAVGGDGLLEVDVNDNPLREILAGPLRYIDRGSTTLTTLAGLGIDPQPAELAEFVVDTHVVA
jgi:L-alanine-DL-glutamate epimerase-like enolase superfamily enzyme